MSNEDKELGTLLQQAEARERIRRRTAELKSRRWKFLLAVFGGLQFAVVDYSNPDHFFFLLGSMAVWIFSFGIYTGFLSFARNYQDEIFYFQWLRFFGLWKKFGREGRTWELVLVLILPGIGRVAEFFPAISK